VESTTKRDALIAARSLTMSITTTRLIKIGNSHGIRIPKLLIEQIGLTSEIELEAQPGQIVLRSGRVPRAGWEAQYKAMAAAGDDHLLDSDELQETTWESGEWEW
jgi:antitoxin MazE